MKNSIPAFILFVTVPAACAFSLTTPSLPAYNNLRTSLSSHLLPGRLRGGASALAAQSFHGEESQLGKCARDLGIEVPRLQPKSMMDKLAGEQTPVIFEAANKYGMSAFGMHEGQQLANTRDHDDRFRVHRVGDGLYQLESLSAPGLFLGVGPRHHMWYPNNGFKATLMPRSSRCDLRVVSPRNGASSFVSFEPVAHPGFLLNHCDGLMWFFDAPANNERIFSMDASWGLLPVSGGGGGLREGEGGDKGVISSLVWDAEVSGTQLTQQEQGTLPGDFVPMDKEKRAHVEVMLEKHLRDRLHLRERLGKARKEWGIENP